MFGLFHRVREKKSEG